MAASISALRPSKPPRPTSGGHADGGSGCYSGDHALECSSGAAVDIQGERGYGASVRLRGRHWDGDHDQDLCLDIGGVCLSRRRLQKLLGTLTEWLELSLDELVGTPLECDHMLALDPNQTVTKSCRYV